LAGSLYFWVDGYWQKHQDTEVERKVFIKRSLEKILAKRPTNKQINQTYNELRNEYIEFEKQNATLINFNDQVLIIENGTTHTVPHSMKYDLKYKLQFNHSYNAKCPAIDRFMHETIGDVDTVNFFYQFVGSSFIRNSEIKIEKVLFLYGTGSNGKSVLLDLLKALFGAKNMSYVPLKDIADETKRIAMVGKLLNIASEGSSKALESDDFKAIVSREELPVRLMHQNATSTNDFPRLIFATNELPQTGGDYSEGLYRRIVIIPFENTIPEEKQDKQLLSKLLPELEGMMVHILSAIWTVNQNKTLTIPPKVLEASRKYEIESNPVKHFIEEAGYYLDNENAPINNSKQLYSEFTSFCNSEGIKKMTQTKFSTQVSSIFGKQAHSNKLYGWRIVRKK